LQRAQLADEARVTAVPDRTKVFGIELGKQRITIMQVRVVRSQAGFKNLPAFTDRFESPPRGLAMAIVSSQIAERLFAFEYRCRPNLLWVWPVTGHVGAIPALWQNHFYRACRKPVCLRPNKCELLQPNMCFCLAALR
jgi:hypothetical protein